METNDRPFHVYNTHSEAIEAIEGLDKSGFDVKKVSLVGKGYHSEEHPVGFYTQGDRIKTWGGIGAAWGGLWGLLFAPAMFFIPGLGLVIGPITAVMFEDTCGNLINLVQPLASGG